MSVFFQLYKLKSFDRMVLFSAFFVSFFFFFFFLNLFISFVCHTFESTFAVLPERTHLCPKEIARERDTTRYRLQRVRETQDGVNVPRCTKVRSVFADGIYKLSLISTNRTRSWIFIAGGASLIGG